MSEQKKAGVAIAPAPWKTKCESYWMIVTLRNGLPEGAYDPLEASSAEYADPKVAGEFKGGLGIIMIVRYHDTPVGPYDELLIIPGNFAVPGKGSSRLRISRIYVNQKETLVNGRHIWNIPKHLARFTFDSHPSTGALTVSVRPPSPAPATAAPFFACTLTPFRWLPSFPFSTKYLPLSTVLAQPPVPSAPSSSSPSEGGGAAADGVRHRAGAGPADEERALLVGTELWREMPIEGYSPRTRGMWIEIHEPGKEPGAKAGKGVGKEELERAAAEAKGWWPVDARPWPVGAWLEDAELVIPKPLEWKL